MILEETINKLLRDTTDLLLSSPGYTIKAKQKDAPRPTGDYGDVDFVSDTGLGWEQFQYEDRDLDSKLDITSKGIRQIMMSIGFYRNSSVDNARKVHQGMTRESVQSLFRQAGLGLTRRSEVREISESLENGWEERAQFDIFLSAVGTDADLVESIGSVDISGEFQARGLTYNFNIEVQ
jgi:hypothetical protein